METPETQTVETPCPDKRYEDNAITEVSIELTYKHESEDDDTPPLVKRTKRRFSGLLLIQEVKPWVNAQYTSQITDITVKSLKVFLGGSPSACNIKVR